MSTEAELLGERIAEMAAHLDAATHGLLTALRDYDRSNNWYEQGFPSCAKWLSWRVGMSSGTAREHIRVAQRLGDLPLIDDALRTGSISYSKVRAMTRVATPANEAMLLEDARHSTGSQLETICRKYAIVVRAAKETDENYDRQRRTVSRRDLEDGMVRIEATLHPEEAALIWAALDQIARERALRVQLAAQMGIEVDTTGSPVAAQDSTASPASQGSTVEVEASATTPAPRGEFNRADALVAMAQSVCRGDAQRRSPIELVVTVAADVLCGVPAGPSRFVAGGAQDDHGRVPAETSVVPQAGLATFAADRQCGVPAGTSVAPPVGLATFAADVLCGVPAGASGATALGALNGDGRVPAGTSLAPAGLSIFAADQPCGVPATTSAVAALAAPDGGRVPAGTSMVSPVGLALSSADRPRGVPAGTSTTRCVPFANGTLASAVRTTLLSPAAAPAAPFAVFADGTCVSAETARRLACDCGVVHMIEDANGNALSVGRKTRMIPAAIRRALEKRDPCCRFPGCTNRLYVEGHHIVHWANGGETSLNNILNVCSFHHRFVHEYGYRVELDDAQRPRFFDRRGREVLDVPEPTRRDRVGFAVIVECNAELEIDAETNTCLWGGERVHYGDVIDALVRVDRLS